MGGVRWPAVALAILLGTSGGFAQTVTRDPADAPAAAAAGEVGPIAALDTVDGVTASTADAADGAARDAGHRPVPRRVAARDRQLAAYAAARAAVGEGIPADYLPFDQPSLAELQASPHKVFAHWFLFPVSRRNEMPPQDEYGAIHNTGERFWDSRLMARPLMRPARPQGYPEFEILDHMAEIRLAQAIGLDAFLVNFFPIVDSGNNQQRIARIVQAAERVDAGFKIGMNWDLINYFRGRPPDPVDTYVDWIIDEIEANGASFDSPAWWRDGDGRYITGTFAANGPPGDWLVDVKAEFARRGIPIHLMCSKNGIGPIAPGEYDEACDSWNDWGRRFPSGADRDYAADFAEVADEPVAAAINHHDSRYRDPTRNHTLGVESGGSRTLRNNWMSAIATGADHAQLVTWNDYGEHGGHMPDTARQFALYDLNAYYITWLKTGVQPEIVRDNLYFFHRVYKGPPWGERHVSGEVFDIPFVNEIELVGFLTAPGTLQIVTEDGVHAEEVAAGIQSIRAPLPDAGNPRFKLLRDGAVVLDVTSPFTIGDPPGGEHSEVETVYRSGSALRMLNGTSQTEGATCYRRGPDACLSPALSEPVWGAQ